jgi:4-amino-4-deoxy-L-arabinose transferase-like glycosyltransferase
MGDLIAGLHDAVTGRRGFPVFLTVIVLGFLAIRVLFPDGPSNDDVKEQLWMAVDWRMGYGSGANPPLFTWLVRIVDSGVGSIVVSAEIVRFALLWLFCFLSALFVMQATDDRRLATLAGLAPLAAYAVGWEALFRHSNTMLLIASIPLTLLTLTRLDRRADWPGYLLFALVTAFGFYSKYNYGVVWIGFIVAALFDDRLRRRLLDWRMIAALVLALLLLSPLLYWISGHLDGMLSHGRARIAEAPERPTLPIALSALLDLAVAFAGLLVPLFVMVAVLCPRAFGRVRDTGGTDPARWRRLLTRYLVVVLAILVAGIFALDTTRFQTRYVYVLLPVLPWIFLRMAATGFGGRRRQWLAAAMVVLTVLVMAGAAIRGATYKTREAAAAEPVVQLVTM